MNKRLQAFITFLNALKPLSKCEDKKQAAIIVNKDLSQVLSIGLNGGPKGGADCLCKLGGKYTCIHAEAQAIAKATTDLTDCIMICTMSPCVTCASLIVNVGIKEVYYGTDYKDPAGLNILREAGVKVTKFEDCV